MADPQNATWKRKEDKSAARSGQTKLVVEIVGTKITCKGYLQGTEVSFRTPTRTFCMKEVAPKAEGVSRLDEPCGS
jgi:hypothetical protein